MGRQDAIEVRAGTSSKRAEVVLVANGRIERTGGVDLLGGRADVEVVDLGGRRVLQGG